MFGFLSNIWVTVGGWAAAALCFGLWFNAASDIKAERERCNTRMAEAVAESESAVAEATRLAAQKKIDALMRQAEAANRALAIAEEAAEMAESRIPEVREVIREVAVTNACIDTDVPAAVLDSLRD